MMFPHTHTHTHTIKEIKADDLFEILVKNMDNILLIDLGSAEYGQPFSFVKRGFHSHHTVFFTRQEHERAIKLFTTLFSQTELQEYAIHFNLSPGMTPSVELDDNNKLFLIIRDGELCKTNLENPREPSVNNYHPEEAWGAEEYERKRASLSFGN